MKTAILQASQSPMNAQQWLCRLECGHEQWVTSKRKPTRKIECKENHTVEKKLFRELQVGESFRVHASPRTFTVTHRMKGLTDLPCFAFVDQHGKKEEHDMAWSPRDLEVEIVESHKK